MAEEGPPLDPATPAAPPPLAPPPTPGTIQPAPTSDVTPLPEPVKAPERRQAEDYVAIVAGALMFIGAFLPWYKKEPFLVLSDAAQIIASLSKWDKAAILVLGLAALAVAALGPRLPLKIRLAARMGLGLAAVGIAGYTAWDYYGFHEAHAPKLGVLGHLAFVGPGVYAALVGGILLTWSAIPTLRPAPAAAPTRVPVEARLSWAMRWVVPLLIFFVAHLVYSNNVSHPAIIDFDEAHYVRVAMNITDGVLIDPGWGEPRPFNFEHPPVGKYLIAAGYALYGEPHDDVKWEDYYQYEQGEKKAGLCKAVNPECARDAESWRWGSVMLGSAGVVGMYWLGLRLFRSASVGLVAATLLLLDNMYYLHSRVAMLDIFPIAFALLAFGVYLGPKKWHPWAGSVLYGLAVASKHTALFLLPAFFLMAYLVSPHDSRWMRTRDALIRALILPFAIYILAYAPYLWIWATEGGLKGQTGIAGALEMFVYTHKEAFTWTYRADVAPHVYVSDPETWIPMRRPVLYYVSYQVFPVVGSLVGHIYALGNPFTWWLGGIGVLYGVFAGAVRFVSARPRLGMVAFWQWLKRPFAMSTQQAELIAALLFVCAFAPFFMLQRDPFNFYFVIACPFFALVLAGHVGPLLSRRGSSRLWGLLFMACAVLVFGFYSPVSDGAWLRESEFQAIMNALPCPPGRLALDTVPCMSQ